MTRIVNLTPHAITIPDCPLPDGSGRAPWTLQPSGKIARATERSSPSEPIAGVPTSWVRYVGTEDLPEPEIGVYYVVSTIAAIAAAEHGRDVDDLLVPGEQIRDAAGRIVGCRSLQRCGRFQSLT